MVAVYALRVTIDLHEGGSILQNDLTQMGEDDKELDLLGVLLRVLCCKSLIEFAIMVLVLVRHNVLHPSLPVFVQICIIKDRKDELLKFDWWNDCVPGNPESFLMMCEASQLERDTFRNLTQVMCCDPLM
jgi:hypothetical protein